MFTHEYYDNHEKCFIFNDLGGRLQGFIAIHDTRLGPALGGCRFTKYDHPNRAMDDVLRLSVGMTHKNSCANLPLGGGKSVLIANRWDGKDRKELFEAFGYHINELGGQYYTAIDVGTSIEDMKIVGKATPYVCGIQRPISGSTAKGAYKAVEGLSEFMGMDIKDMSFAIQGLGQTGWGMLERLHAAGVRNITVSDINADVVKKSLDFEGVTSVDSSGDDILRTDCDVLMPCALGGVISARIADQLHCKAICGIANNQLTYPASVSKTLKSLGILYVPDFIVNAGGVIAACQDVTGDDHMIELDAIKDRTLSILRLADEGNVDTHSVAMDMSMARLLG